ncbi:MAG: bacillithiol system redox-active protein YtxJ [Bacteroidia bacterium]|nr:bacillithiol system redox-active protein YtxJ [Bacteroidia bacterium]
MELQNLRDQHQLENIQTLSFSKEIDSVLIFKHSTRCPISAMAKNRLERRWDFAPGKVPFFFLDLLKHRDISDRIASLYGVQHESPQVLLIKNGKCIFHASHNAISADAIREHLPK